MYYLYGQTNKLQIEITQTVTLTVQNGRVQKFSVSIRYSEKSF